MITRATLSTIEQGLPKYRSMLAGNAAYSPGAYENIASFTASGGESVFSFTSIPATYQHLQIRYSVQLTTSSGALYLKYNNSSSFDYAYHYLEADGSSSYASASAGGVDNYFYIANQSYASSNNVPMVGIIDIHDYASTTKNKTARFTTGITTNGAAAQRLRLGSGVKFDTNAIASLQFGRDGGTSFAANSVIALYGIKGV